MFHTHHASNKDKMMKRSFTLTLVTALAVAFLGFLASADILSAQEAPVYTVDNPPPPPMFESRTLQFRVISDAQAAEFTYRAVYEGGEGSLAVDLVVGTEMDVFVPSDANISSNVSAVGNRASLKPGRKFTVTRFIAMANGLVANDLKVRSGLVVSAVPVAGLAEGRRGYWGNLPAAKLATDNPQSWGAIKAGFQE